MLGTASHERKRNKSMFLSPLCYRRMTEPETENMVRGYEANSIIKICLKCDGRTGDRALILCGEQDKASQFLCTNMLGVSQTEKKRKEFLRKGQHVKRPGWRYDREC